MQRYYFDKLGVEHSRWLPLAGDLLCGFSADTSCRDLARFGLLWANEGMWPGADGEPVQLMGRQYSIEGRSWVFPNSGRDYGYTLPLSSNDPVGKLGVRLQAPFCFFRLQRPGLKRSCVHRQHHGLDGRHERPVRAVLARARRGDRHHGQRRLVRLGVGQHPRRDRLLGPSVVQRNAASGAAILPRARACPSPLHLPLDLLVLVHVLVFLHVLVILLLLPCPGSAPFTDGGAPSPQATAARAEERQLRADILALAPFMREHAHRFSAEDLAIYSERLVGYGEPPIVHAEKK